MIFYSLFFLMYIFKKNYIYEIKNLRKNISIQNVHTYLQKHNFYIDHLFEMEYFSYICLSRL